jgi:hypothetical protein
MASRSPRRATGNLRVAQESALDVQAFEHPRQPIGLGRLQPILDRDRGLLLRLRVFAVFFPMRSCGMVTTNSRWVGSTILTSANMPT